MSITKKEARNKILEIVKEMEKDKFMLPCNRSKTEELEEFSYSTYKAEDSIPSDRYINFEIEDRFDIVISDSDIRIDNYYYFKEETDYKEILEKVKKIYKDRKKKTKSNRLELINRKIKGTEKEIERKNKEINELKKTKSKIKGRS